jgi:hypothetical protein
MPLQKSIMIDSCAIAASIEATAQDISTAAATYQRCPRGGRVRADLLASIDQLHERLGHQLVILARKHGEERHG